jgi:hypothetical protein
MKTNQNKPKERNLKWLKFQSYNRRIFFVSGYINLELEPSTFRIQVTNGIVCATLLIICDTNVLTFSAA